MTALPSLLQAKVDNVGGAWKKYTLSLVANAANPRTRLVISQATKERSGWIVVSLYPRKSTFKGTRSAARSL